MIHKPLMNIFLELTMAQVRICRNVYLLAASPMHAIDNNDSSRPILFHANKREKEIR